MSVLKLLKSSKKRTAALICSIVIVICLIPSLILTFSPDPNNPFTIKEETLMAEDGTHIQALIYTPVDTSGDHPGVVVGHGFCGNKQYMNTLSIEIVKRGFVVVNIDFRGHGSSGGELPEFSQSDYHFQQLVMDIEAGMNYLNNLNYVNKIGLVGHSMGGMTVSKVAEQHTSEISVVVNIGMAPAASAFEEYAQMLDFSLPDYNLSKIPNILVAIGKFEQVIPEVMALEFLKDYTRLENVQSGVQYGNFSDRNATKVYVSPNSEHFLEVSDSNILYEMVEWLEIGFNGITPNDIVITGGLRSRFSQILVVAVVALCFVLFAYLHNFIWKNAERKNILNSEEDAKKDIKTYKLILYYIIGTAIQLTLFLPLSTLFDEVLPVAMGQLLYAQIVGAAIGVLIVYCLFILKREERLELKYFSLRLQKKYAPNWGRALIFGILSAVLLIVAIASITHWTMSPLFPTIREIGAIIGMSILFFPFILIKEFYLRTIQDKIKFSNKYKEQFGMVGLGVLMDSAILLIIMIFSWGIPGILGFIALALTAVIAITVIQQFLMTWIYIYSERNILASTVFMCIFYGFIIVNFFPFGESLF